MDQQARQGSGARSDNGLPLGEAEAAELREQIHRILNGVAGVRQFCQLLHVRLEADSELQELSQLAENSLEQVTVEVELLRTWLRSRLPGGNPQASPE